MNCLTSLLLKTSIKFNNYEHAKKQSTVDWEFRKRS